MRLKIAILLAAALTAAAIIRAETAVSVPDEESGQSAVSVPAEAAVVMETAEPAKVEPAPLLSPSSSIAGGGGGGEVEMKLAFSPPSPHGTAGEKVIIERRQQEVSRRNRRAGKPAVVRGHYLPAGHKPVYQHIKCWNPASKSFVEARDAQVFAQSCAYIDQRIGEMPPLAMKKAAKGGKGGGTMTATTAVIIAAALVAAAVMIAALIGRQEESLPTPPGELLGALREGLVQSASAWTGPGGSGWRATAAPSPREVGQAEADGASARTVEAIKAQQSATASPPPPAPTPPTTVVIVVGGGSSAPSPEPKPKGE